VTSAPALLIRKLPRVPRDNAVRTASPTWTIELVRDRRTREPVAAATMAELKRDLVARGLLPFVVDNRIHVVPPAVITPAEARHGLRLIDEALSALGN
jgi:taurine--2-oxoglutarate transaminase